MKTDSPHDFMNTPDSIKLRQIRCRKCGNIFEQGMLVHVSLTTNSAYHLECAPQVTTVKEEEYVQPEPDFLVQMFKEEDGSEFFVNIGFWDSEVRQFQTDSGYIHENFETHRFHYIKLDWIGLRNILRQVDWKTIKQEHPK
jgi:hypothetical protein